MVFSVVFFRFSANIFKYIFCFLDLSLFLFFFPCFSLLFPLFFSAHKCKNLLEIGAALRLRTLGFFVSCLFFLVCSSSPDKDQDLIIEGKLTPT